MSKSRVLYEETYRKGRASIRKDLLPERLPYFAEGTKLVSMELRKAGWVEIDGEKFEFELVYILIKPAEES